MDESTRRLERSKLNELAREYRNKGFEVLIEPKGVDLPTFLRNANFQPDMIALSEHEKLVFEIKTRESIRADIELANFSNLVAANEDWEFVLVYTNPKSRQTTKNNIGYVASENLFESFETIRNLVTSNPQQEILVAALLYCWAGIEAAIQNALSTERKNKSGPKTPASLIRDAVIAGLISRDTHEFLENMMLRRNHAAHGQLDIEISQREIGRIISIGESISRGERDEDH